MVKDLASRVRRLYGRLGEAIDTDCRASSYDCQCGGSTRTINAGINTYFCVRSMIRDYFPELKLKTRLDEKE